MNGIGSKKRKVVLPPDPVINCMSGFDIMVSNCSCIITQVVQYVSNDMLTGGVDEVVIVGERVTLQNISVVKKNNLCAFLTLYNRCNIGQGTSG